MYEALLKGALAAVGLETEEANALIRGAFEKVDDMHATIKRVEARIKRLEEKAGIPPLAEILPPAMEGEKNERTG